MINRETQEARSGLMLPTLRFKLMITGIEPMISMTAKSTVLTFRISTKSKVKDIRVKLIFNTGMSKKTMPDWHKNKEIALNKI
jgi:hypothetical protein